MSERMQWDKEDVLQLATIFNSMVEFRLAYHGAYKHAVRHGYLDEVRAIVLHRSDTPQSLLYKLASALGDSRRRYGVAAKIRSIGHWGTEPSSDEVGRPLDFDLSQWEQSAEEAEGGALDVIERLQAVGSEHEIKQAWHMYLIHQVHGRLGRARVLTNSQQGGK